ncbi:hypothetical protein DYE50_06960 [Treponema ruminis]|nr:hypothetical protein DYE50_06960 [Treponema ruminis]
MASPQSSPQKFPWSSRQGAVIPPGAAKRTGALARLSSQARVAAFDNIHPLLLKIALEKIALLRIAAGEFFVNA